MSSHLTVEDALEAVIADAAVHSAVESYVITYPSRLVRVLRRPQYLPYDTTPPAVPQGLEVQSYTQHTATLVWDANTEIDFLLYKVYQSDSSTGYTANTLLYQGNGVTVTASDLRPSLTYQFKMLSRDQTGNESNFTAAVAFTPPIPTTAAVVALYDSANVFSSYGPSPSPLGLFYGRTDLDSGDTYTVLAPSGLTITEYTGGVISASGPAGTFSIPWDIYDSSAATYIIGQGSVSLV